MAEHSNGQSSSLTALYPLPPLPTPAPLALPLPHCIPFPQLSSNYTPLLPAQVSTQPCPIHTPLSPGGVLLGPRL